MKTLIKFLFLSVFWFSCEQSADLEGETVELWGTFYSIENTFELDLTSSGLTGEIPTEIGELINLEKLDLKSNSLIGNIPSSLSNLQNLTELNLYNNQLTGELSSAITELTNLNYLTLENNQFSGPIPESINNLSNLIGLDLRNNMFSGELPSEINELVNLENLYLHQNEFSGEIDLDICELSIDFSSVEYFNIDNNQFCPPYPECIIREEFEDVNEDGSWTPEELYEDTNEDGSWTPEEPYEDTNEDGSWTDEGCVDLEDDEEECLYIDNQEECESMDGRCEWTPEELYEDTNEDGSWTPEEPYTDRNNNNQYDEDYFNFDNQDTSCCDIDCEDNNYDDYDLPECAVNCSGLIDCYDDYNYEDNQDNAAFCECFVDVHDSGCFDACEDEEDSIILDDLYNYCSE